MLSTLTVAGRTVVKRLSADWLIVAAAFITVLLATVLLASGPIYADAVTISSLQRSLSDAPVEEAYIEASVHVYPEFHDRADEITRATVDRSLSATGAATFAHIEADAFEIEGAEDGVVTTLASLHYFEALENHATLLAGRWPGEAGVAEVALHAPAAVHLDVEVGDTFTVVNRRDPSLRVALTIVGTYQIEDATDPYWLNDTLSLSGIEESPSFRSVGPFAVTRETLLSELTPVRANADWRILPEFENLEVPEVDGYRARVAGLADELTDELFTSIPPAASGASSGFAVATDLDNLLTDVDRSLTVTRSSVLALLVQLALLAGYALVLTAGLLVDTRRTETNLARSRGTSPGQVLGIALLEGLVLTVPAMILAPHVATWLLGILNQVGPIASVGLTIEPEPTVESFILAGLAAGLAVVALAWPAYRSARRFGSSETRHGRQSSRGGAQRVGVDLALVALAFLVFWQLQTIGPDVSARVRGQFGIDPLLVVAPAMALLAGAILALRMIPLLARIAEWLATSRRAAVAALASWQVARRPTRYARSALLLILAIGIGFFAASYSTTWIASQRDQAAHAVGADISLIPDRATGTSIDDTQLTSLHRSIPGVKDSMPVSRLSGQLVRGESLVDILLLDASRADGIVAIRDELSPDFAELMALLAEARPALAGIELPGEPVTLELELEAVEEIPEDEGLEQCGPEPVGPETCFNARARVVLVDGDGLLHRVDAGVLIENQGPQTLAIPLTRTDGGPDATPVYPIELVSIEIESQLAAHSSRSVDLTISGFDLVDGAGQVSQVSVPMDWETWEPATTTVVGSSVRPQITPGPEGDGEMTAVIETGSGFNVAPAYFTLRPTGTSLPDSFPVIVSETFPDSAFVGLGDETRLPPLRIQRDNVLVAGTIGPFPTIDDGTRETVIADLATYQVMGYQPGRGLGPADYHWLATTGVDDRAVVSRLLAAPLDSFAVDSRESLTQSLLSDPVALGTIGALTVGFVAAAVFAAVGFAVSATVSARERLVEFALLRAVGLSSRQLGSWLVLEQGVLVAVSLALGTAIGVLLTAFILPLVTLTQDGAPAVPDVIVMYPWPTILVLELAVLAVLGLIVTVMTFLLRRIGLGSLLRLGEE